MSSEYIEHQWKSAVSGCIAAQKKWRTWQAGTWKWNSLGLELKSNEAGWSGYEWIPNEEFGAKSLRQFTVEITLCGTAEAVGLSLGPFKDFLISISSKNSICKLQLEVDASVGIWAFRVNGKLCTRQWWDAGIGSRNDLLNGILTLKMWGAGEVLFSDLTIRSTFCPCHISVITTSYRFAERLRVSTRNWLYQDVPFGSHELLVVNPESPDRTHEILDEMIFSYPHVSVKEVFVEERLRLNKGAMLNRAINIARGEWIWFTDSDCLFPANAISTTISQIGDRTNAVYFGRRRQLSAALTRSILCGRLDGVRDFQFLLKNISSSPDDNNPWGYTQILHRTTLQTIQYRENINGYGSSDIQFIEDCRKRHIPIQQLPGLVCLHLDHPFAWHGTYLNL